MTCSFIKSLLACVVAGGVLAASAQRAPFYGDIQAFLKADNFHPPPQHAILFIGSSSFTMWKDVQDYFPGYAIINRGFGGSSLPDVIRYAGDIIIPYHPRQVVIYCGDNDFAMSSLVTSDSVANRFKRLFWLIRKNLPGAAIAFVSVKPSPSRAGLMEREEVANASIRDFLSSQRNTAFIDVYHPMLDENGRPRSSIFLSDSLHMNAHGYVIWKKVIQPFLVK